MKTLYATLLVGFLTPEASAQFLADAHPCSLVPPQEYTPDGRRSWTPEAYNQLLRCENARLAELQTVLDSAGIDCQALDLMLGDCSIDTIVDTPPQMVVPGADAAAQIDALDRMIDALSEGIVAE